MNSWLRLKTRNLEKKKKTSVSWHNSNWTCTLLSKALPPKKKNIPGLMKDAQRLIYAAEAAWITSEGDTRSLSSSGGKSSLFQLWRNHPSGMGQFQDRSSCPSAAEGFSLKAISHLELIYPSADTQSTFCLQYSLSHHDWWGRSKWARSTNKGRRFCPDDVPSTANPPAPPTLGSCDGVSWPQRYALHSHMCCWLQASSAVRVKQTNKQTKT